MFKSIFTQIKPQDVSQDIMDCEGQMQVPDATDASVVYGADRNALDLGDRNAFGDPIENDSVNEKAGADARLSVP